MVWMNLKVSKYWLNTANVADSRWPNYDFDVTVLACGVRKSASWGC